MRKKVINKKTWKEFQETGLLLFLNQILHVFGWCIIIEYESDIVTNVYPARTRFRGFNNKIVSNSYIKIIKYLSKNINNLMDECNDK